MEMRLLYLKAAMRHQAGASQVLTPIHPFRCTSRGLRHHLTRRASNMTLARTHLSLPVCATTGPLAPHTVCPAEAAAGIHCPVLAARVRSSYQPEYEASPALMETPRTHQVSSNEDKAMMYAGSVTFAWRLSRVKRTLTNTPTKALPMEDIFVPNAICGFEVLPSIKIIAECTPLRKNIGVMRAGVHFFGNTTSVGTNLMCTKRRRVINVKFADGVFLKRAT